MLVTTFLSTTLLLASAAVAQVGSAHLPFTVSKSESSGSALATFPGDNPPPSSASVVSLITTPLPSDSGTMSIPPGETPLSTTSSAAPATSTPSLKPSSTSSAAPSQKTNAAAPTLKGDGAPLVFALAGAAFALL